MGGNQSDVSLWIHQEFIRKKLLLGFAESCTGGQLSALITQYPGASQYFMGSVISYSGKIKNKLLGVPDDVMASFGEVSVPVAKIMAQGSREALMCDWTVSVTGIAGPTGGTPSKPVGTVCFAVCGPDFEYAEQKHIEGSERRIIQQRSAEHALTLLKMALES
jgi:nicotinamide-nucleotide amidase